MTVDKEWKIYWLGRDRAPKENEVREDWEETELQKKMK